MILRKWEELPLDMQTDEVRHYYDILKKKQGSLVFKRLFDFVVSLIMLLFLSPVFVILAIKKKEGSHGEI